jgi:hypothetical protein
MKKIETTCPACRATVAVEAAEILLAVPTPGPATYTIVCPACDALTAKHAGAAVVGLLRTIEVPTVRFVPGHPESPSPGPPLRLDDLLELHQLLTTEDWLSQWERTS